MAPEPTLPMKFFEDPLPKKVMNKNPASGNNGMSVTSFSMPIRISIC
jgi:hypothetical protein